MIYLLDELSYLVSISKSYILFEVVQEKPEVAYWLTYLLIYEKWIFLLVKEFRELVQ